jgi:hypothetical protein
MLKIGQVKSSLNGEISPNLVTLIFSNIFGAKEEQLLHR